MLKSLPRNFILWISFVLCILFLRSSKSLARGSNHTSNNASKPVSVCAPENKTLACDEWIFLSGEYVVFPDRTAYVTVVDLKLDECSYVLRGDRLFTCRSGLQKEGLTLPCGVQLALCISVFSVVLPMFFSMMTEDVRELVHVNWRGLVISLFLFHLLLQTVNMDRVSSVPEFKYTFPSLMHFFTLVLLSWMTIMSHDGMMMSESMSGRNRSYLELMRNFRGHILSIINSIILLAMVTFLTEYLRIIPPNFKPLSGDFCWLTQKTLLLFFTGPVLGFNMINFLSFISTYFYFTKRRNGFEGPLLVLKKNYLIHFKLFVMVDITWLVGVLIFLTEVEWLWRIFVCLFMFEEAFIVVVPFNKQLEKWVLKKLSGS